ncbi:hypothetical protein ACF3DV_15845 [Chlorogloeopsis fritschii PCC 9212]|uniref:Uncharacterized protein n=1 Tax=Chlorogloeopsis fritschii PCC 6912 TaxID=211165 RepID=A0A433NKL1_CHLFR|nr:hypothetical protein [Chlorogloeopsis fritschii]MBF2005091.1 hypothetical protein [Chlorogloeopsis fritschii C42_A2020_084]RUR83350.1 hypothetical protein PCC6912_21830 [Chlorogloeopsis fritschii PCC 6912]
MSKPIYELVDELPKGGLTVAALNSLDFVVPGQWNNLVGFVNTIRVVTGETDEALIQQIGERAVTLFNDKSQGYQRALWLYETVDSASGFLGAAALMNRIGQDTFLGFLKNLTPKPERAQSIDLCVKLVTELVAFCQINGIPGDSIGDFLAALKDYGGESLMRMTALVSFDGLIPLGAGFTDQALSVLKGMSPSDLEQNQTFKGVKDLIPGENAAGQLGFITQSFESTKGWMDSFVSSKQLTQAKVVDNLSNFVQFSKDKLDYVGAFLDVSVKYYRHTGIQTLARRLIERAVAEI